MKAIRILYILTIGIVFNLSLNVFALGPRSHAINYIEESVDLPDGYTAKIVFRNSELFPNRALEIEVDVFDGFGAKRNGDKEILLYVFPEFQTIVSRIFYPNFVPLGATEGKGRILLRKIVLRPEFNGFHVIGTAKEKWRASFVKITELRPVIKENYPIGTQERKAIAMPGYKIVETMIERLQVLGPEKNSLIEFLLREWKLTTRHGVVNASNSYDDTKKPSNLQKLLCSV